MIEKTTAFLSDVKSEVKKVTWPSKNEAMAGTGVVVFVVFVVAVFLGIIDTVLSKIVESLVS